MVDFKPLHVWRPTTLDQLLQLQQAQPARFLLAGGTVALPSWQNDLAPAEVIYLPSISVLHERGASWCGSAVTLADIAAEPAYPTALRQAAASIASPGIRTIATLGGNIANPGDRCLAVALLALDAWLEVLDSATGTIRRLPLERCLPDLKQTIIRAGWSVQAGSSSCFTKFGVRATSGMNLATVAVHVDDTESGSSCAFAVGATGVAPHRLPETERTWQEMRHRPEQAAVALGQAAAREVRVQEVDLIPAAYRKEVVGVLIERAIRTFMKEGLA